MNAAIGLTTGAGLGAALAAGLWLWQRHGTAVWLELGLGWCF
jgi:hypothetical protein